ncbi:peptidase M4 family protein [Bacillus sp. SB49]|uniref:M4 family metallopeptidase n=1 Tax=Bacillaceae TaxID=186817 RepID=UPI0002A520C1|nr:MULTISPECIES: M4 family metallopeptidase [Bacillaceae]ELK48027.1 neutral protease [Halobacillus sp. BAB-2008]QHT45665.1 peptidase M4 family protein [Bacillus sp. SB49]
MKKRVVTSTLALTLALSGFGFGAGSVSAEEAAKVKNNDTYGTPSYIIEKWEMPKMKAASSEKATVESIALSYLNYKNDLFKLKGNSKDNFQVLDTLKDEENGTSHVRLIEQYDGVPVYGAHQTVALNDKKEVQAFFGQVVPNLEAKELDSKPELTDKEAVEIAKASIEDEIGKVEAYDAEPSSDLYFYEYEGDFHLAFLVKASTSEPAPGYFHYFVDAKTGDIVNHYNAIDHVKAFGEEVNGDKAMFEAVYEEGSYYLFDETRGDGIHTFDALNMDPFLFNLFSQLLGYHGDEVTSDHKFFSDPAAVSAHKNAGIVYDYFKDTFDRDSFDDEGARMISSVHVGDKWNNAAWNGVQMMYGDGDGETYLPFSGAVDVIAHELAHAVTDRSADLVYQDEPGALNESMSDIFGAMVDRDDWLMGEEVGVDGEPLRSMEDPSSIPHPFYPDRGYPDHYSELYTGDLDNGGVHINSSINNKAAYLLAEGGTHYDIEVEGVGRDATEQIYYRALTKYLTATSDFSMMRQAAIQSAIDLYGEGSQEVTSVNQAYDAVGIQ